MQRKLQQRQQHFKGYLMGKMMQMETRPFRKQIAFMKEITAKQAKLDIWKDKQKDEAKTEKKTIRQNKKAKEMRYGGLLTVYSESFFPWFFSHSQQNTRKENSAWKLTKKIKELSFQLLLCDHFAFGDRIP